MKWPFTIVLPPRTDGNVLSFRKDVPAGSHSPRLSQCIEVHLRTSLRVVVLAHPDEQLLRAGSYAAGRVDWDPLPSSTLPSIALQMVSADIAAAMHLFETGYLRGTPPPLQPAQARRPSRRRA